MKVDCTCWFGNSEGPQKKRQREDRASMLSVSHSTDTVGASVIPQDVCVLAEQISDVK